MMRYLEINSRKKSSAYKLLCHNYQRTNIALLKLTFPVLFNYYT